MGVGREETPLQHESALQRACRDAGLSHDDLWLRYFGLGGREMPADVREYVRGSRQPDRLEHNILVHAVNERYMELDRPERLPYAAEGRRFQEQE